MINNIIGFIVCKVESPTHWICISPEHRQFDNLYIPRLLSHQEAVDLLIKLEEMFPEDTYKILGTFDIEQKV